MSDESRRGRSASRPRPQTPSRTPTQPSDTGPYPLAAGTLPWFKDKAASVRENTKCPGTYDWPNWSDNPDVPDEAWLALARSEELWRQLHLRDMPKLCSASASHTLQAREAGWRQRYRDNCLSFFSRPDIAGENPDTGTRYTDADLSKATRAKLLLLGSWIW